MLFMTVLKLNLMPCNLSFMLAQIFDSDFVEYHQVFPTSYL